MNGPPNKTVPLSVDLSDPKLQNPERNFVGILFQNR